MPGWARGGAQQTEGGRQMSWQAPERSAVLPLLNGFLVYYYLLIVGIIFVDLLVIVDSGFAQPQIFTYLKHSLLLPG